MNAATRQLLAELDERAAREHREIVGLDAGELEKRRDDFLLPVGREVGELMRMLIVAAKAKVIVELGTCRGYSTLWLAEAARASAGRVITFENDERKQSEARRYVQSAGLSDVVDFRLGDATALVRELPAPVDFALIDLWKELYIPCFDLLLPKLGPGALVIADNMLFPLPARRDAEAYRRHVRSKPGIESVLLPLGSGIEVSRRAT